MSVAHPPARRRQRSHRRAHRSLVHHLAFAPAVLLLVACAAGERDGRAEPLVRDSAGVTIVEHPAELTAPVEWTLTLDDAVRLEGEFDGVRHGVRMADGRVIVADGDSRSLRIHAADGAPLASVGRAGGGPGEFRGISSLSRWPGDSLLAWDIQQRRLTLFDDQGNLGRTFALATSTDVPFGNVQGVFADGSMLTTGFVAGGGPEPGRSRSQAPVHRFRRDGTLETTYPFMTGGEAFFDVFDGGFSVTAALFARSATPHVGQALLVEADNERFELRLRATSGELQRIVRRGGVTPAITPELRAAVVEHTLAALPNDETRERRRPALESMPVPERLPAFGRVHVDRLDHVWVEEYAPIPGERSTWWVFASDGALVARATMPQRVTVLEVGPDYMLGGHRDALDVEEVVVMRLRRG